MGGKQKAKEKQYGSWGVAELREEGKRAVMDGSVEGVGLSEYKPERFTTHMVNVNVKRTG